MTSLAYIFTTEEALVKIIFGRLYICKPIFKIFVPFLGLLECEEMTRSYVYVGDFIEQDDMQKGCLKRGVVRRVFP